MNYVWKLIPVIVIVLALGGAIYYVVSEEPKFPPSPQTQVPATRSLVPPSYTNKSS